MRIKRSCEQLVMRRRTRCCIPSVSGCKNSIGSVRRPSLSPPVDHLPPVTREKEREKVLAKLNLDMEWSGAGDSLPSSDRQEPDLDQFIMVSWVSLSTKILEQGEMGVSSP